MSALEILIAIIGNIVATEIYQNLPNLALWMVRRAADRLPPEKRGSVGQTWIEDQTRIAGYLARIGHALECWRKTLLDEFARRKVIESAFERARIRIILAASYVPFVLATLVVVLLLLSSFYSIWEGISSFTGGNGVYARALSFLITLGISACFTIFSFLIVEIPFGLGRWRPTESKSFRLRIMKALDQAPIFVGFTVALFTSVFFSYVTFYEQISTKRLSSVNGETGHVFVEAIIALEKGDKLAILAFAVSVSVDFLILMAVILWHSRVSASRQNPLKRNSREAGDSTFE